ncbi:hypothetical protein [Elongatibacter sediminis]|uniref:VWFA domain-containing protein n=1 Tax=Elongatibacter sediminis TaxID=3119006 RepID=A0AAW9RBE3_9GAMM
MKARRRGLEVFSLSAIDLFASAMGAFIIITLILMPDYQKEVRSQGDLELLEELAGRTEAELDQVESGVAALERRLSAARQRAAVLAAEQADVASAIRVEEAERLAQAPPPAPVPEIEEVVEEPREVSFRFLGLKTRQTRLLFLVDMNGFLGQHRQLVQDTVLRGIEALDDGYEFAILGFQQLDSGIRYHRWPEGDDLVRVSSQSRAGARQFLASLDAEFRGSSSLLDALDRAFASSARAIVLVSDGLPNPEFNRNLSGSALVRTITLANRQRQEIHTVTIGDYFKYRGTVEFMEALARANSGQFLALAP